MKRVCTECLQELDILNFSLRKTSKDGLNKRCKLCIKVASAKLHIKRRNRPENIEKRKRELELSEQRRLDRKLSRPVFNKKEYQRLYHLRNKEKLNAYSRASHKKRMQDPVGILLERKRGLDYYYANKSKFRAIEAKRNFLQRHAKLKCLTKEDHEDIHVYYFVSRNMSLSGVKYNVDHIVPIKHRNVCGLHVPWNLRILEEALNKSKGNKFHPELGVDKSAEYYRKQFQDLSKLENRL